MADLSIAAKYYDLSVARQLAIVEFDVDSDVVQTFSSRVASFGSVSHSDLNGRSFHCGQVLRSERCQAACHRRIRCGFRCSSNLFVAGGVLWIGQPFRSEWPIFPLRPSTTI